VIGIKYVGVKRSSCGFGYMRMSIGEGNVKGIRKRGIGLRIV